MCVCTCTYVCVCPCDKLCLPVKSQVPKPRRPKSPQLHVDFLRRLACRLSRLSVLIHFSPAEPKLFCNLVWGCHAAVGFCLFFSGGKAVVLSPLKVNQLPQTLKGDFILLLQKLHWNWLNINLTLHHVSIKHVGHVSYLSIDTLLSKYTDFYTFKVSKVKERNMRSCLWPWFQVWRLMTWGPEGGYWICASALLSHIILVTSVTTGKLYPHEREKNKG